MTPAPEVTARLGTGSVSRPGQIADDQGTRSCVPQPGREGRATGDADRESTTDRGSPRLLDAPAIITLTQGMYPCVKVIIADAPLSGSSLLSRIDGREPRSELAKNPAC